MKHVEEFKYFQHQKKDFDLCYDIETENIMSTLPQLRKLFFKNNKLPLLSLLSIQYERIRPSSTLSLQIEERKRQRAAQLKSKLDTELSNELVRQQQQRDSLLDAESKKNEKDVLKLHAAVSEHSLALKSTQSTTSEIQQLMFE